MELDKQTTFKNCTMSLDMALKLESAYIRMGFKPSIEKSEDNNVIFNSNNWKEDN